MIVWRGVAMGLTTEQKQDRDRRRKNAAKQARYRERALIDPAGLGLVRLQVLVSKTSHAEFSRAKKRKQWTNQEAMEAAISLLSKYTAKQ